MQKSLKDMGVESDKKWILTHQNIPSTLTYTVNQILSVKCPCFFQPLQIITGDFFTTNLAICVIKLCNRLHLMLHIEWSLCTHQNIWFSKILSATHDELMGHMHHQPPWSQMKEKPDKCFARFVLAYLLEVLSKTKMIQQHHDVKQLFLSDGLWELFNRLETSCPLVSAQHSGTFQAYVHHSPTRAGFALHTPITRATIVITTEGTCCPLADPSCWASSDNLGWSSSRTLGITA